MTELTDRIDEAFTRPDPADAIRLVKVAVQDELKGLDAELALEETRFFNHAIYSDVVLRWHERGMARERPVFLRFEIAEGTVAQDLRLHGDKASMFIGLLDHRAAVEPPESFEDKESEPGSDGLPEPPPGDTLLAEAAAIDALQSFARERPIQVVATSAIARAGHGRLSGDDAEALGATLSLGFEAASEG